MPQSDIVSSEISVDISGWSPNIVGMVALTFSDNPCPMGNERGFSPCFNESQRILALPVPPSSTLNSSKGMESMLLEVVDDSLFVTPANS